MKLKFSTEESLTLPAPTQDEEKKTQLIAIWLPHGQLWAIIEAAASLNHVNHFRFTYSTQGSPGPT